MHKSILKKFIYFVSFFMLAAVFQLNAKELELAIANSTCQVMQKVGKLYTQKTSIPIKCICKSSGLLAKGIKGQAISADIYVSANKTWMDYVVAQGFIAEQSVQSPWGNQLVVAAPKNSPLKLQNWNQLTAKKVKSVMIGDPGTAPFGRYAKQAMQMSGVWDSVKKKIKTKKHITILADSLAQSDSYTVGILFRTNVNQNKLKVFDIVDKKWHKPIRYYIAPLKISQYPKLAEDFIHFLNSDEVKQLFKSNGFIFPEA